MHSPNCNKCTYNSSEQDINKRFICNECESNEFKLTSNGECEKCKISNCEECYYNNNSQQICNKCNEGYYIDSLGKC